MIASASVPARAIGLVHIAAGVHSPDRWWYRALVVRHARDHGVQLLDILELHDNAQHDARELLRLATLAAQIDASILITHGVQPDLADRLAADLGVQHLPAPHTDRPQPPEEDGHSRAGSSPPS